MFITIEITSLMCVTCEGYGGLLETQLNYSNFTCYALDRLKILMDPRNQASFVLKSINILKTALLLSKLYLRC